MLVLLTSIEDFIAKQVLTRYKNLADIERGFRVLNTVTEFQTYSGCCNGCGQTHVASFLAKNRYHGPSSHPGIPLTNNAAERALWPYVVWRKIGFFIQSYRDDQFRPLILSITETCKRLRVGAYKNLRHACQQGLRGETVVLSCQVPDDWWHYVLFSTARCNRIIRLTSVVYRIIRQ
ncbi:MAG: hypothetical protein ACU843_02105 [Gammaproteobacteria bacterium]